MPGVSFQSRALAVTHNAISIADEPDSFAAVRGIDGTSRENDRPCFVSFVFQVSKHSVEPIDAKRRRNLFSHDDSGPAGMDESTVFGPEMPFVFDTALLADDAERLARARPGPEFPIIGPTGETRGERPSADAGKEVALRVPRKIARLNIHDAALIHVSRRNQFLLYEVPQPLRREWVVLVVVRRHFQPLKTKNPAAIFR
jgi:hypothetical protein